VSEDEATVALDILEEVLTQVEHAHARAQELEAVEA
jgi:hypothetical protein